MALGLKSFTAKGLPVTNSSHITGPRAKVIGIICILIGLAFVLNAIVTVIIMRPEI